MSPESVGELHAHVTEAAQSHDAHFLAFANLPVVQRRVGGDAGTKQRSRPRSIETVRHLQDKSLVHDDALAVAAISDSAEDFVLAVVGEGHRVFTILLLACFTA